MPEHDLPPPPDPATDQAMLHIATKLVFGENSIDTLGEHAQACGGGPALLVTDHGVAEVGHADRALASLAKAGVEAILFEGVHENPTTMDVEQCLEVAKASNIELFIGLGGGSPIDTARGCNFLFTNGGRMQDYWGVGKASKAMKPMIAVPTTTGTGSEMQSFALIADAETHQKMACGDKKAAAKVAILDPTLSCTQPRVVMAHTGLDCLGHALETAVTTKHTPFSRLFSTEACRLVMKHFTHILDEPMDLESQGQMLLASAFSGIAIEHSMLGAAHAMANPLTAMFDVAHGEAVGMMLPHVMLFNSACDSARDEYARLAVSSGLIAPDASPQDAFDSLHQKLVSILHHAGMPDSLTAHGVSGDSIESMVLSASKQWTGQFNPIPPTNDDFQAMYRAAL
ncbi:MAG: iron-containing alcohol dehydrogenase [Planctomycetota bacterium]|nr:iron-containing alcohol dehydrogenase [Planctomycetota bacterium]